MSIQVHPRRGYLNTDILISNHGDETVRLRDRLDGDEFSIAAGESVRKRFFAGEHILDGVTVSGIPVCEVFTVEAALKFGGSRVKDSHVFDDTPWMLIVMMDRTYFFNADTGEEFVEFGICPDGVLCIGGQAMVFTTGSDVSVMSLDRMDIVRSFQGATPLFRNGNCCVFERSGGLLLFDVSGETTEGSFREIKAEKYAFDKGRDILYYTTAPGREVFRQPLAASECGEALGQPEKITLPYPFVCFADSGMVLMSDTPDRLFVMYPDRTVPVKIYDAPVPLSEVNGVQVWKNEVAELLRKEDCTTDGYTRTTSLEVFWRGKRRYVLTESEFLVRQGNRLSRTTKCILEGGGRLLSSDSRMAVVHRAEYDCFTCEGEDYVITESGMFKYSGLLVEGRGGKALVFEKDSTGAEIVRTPEGRELGDVERRPDQSLFFQSTGFVRLYDDTFGSSLHWAEAGLSHRYAGRDVITGKGYCIVRTPDTSGTGAVPDRIFLPGGHIAPVPVPPEQIVRVSAKAETVLFKADGSYGYAVRRDGEWKVVREGVFTLFDPTRVDEAAFCGDGRSFVYRTAEGLVMHDFESGAETPFPEPVEIVKNINGYRTYLDPDCLRPVSVDPVTHRRLDARTLLQYTFSNADGSLYYRCRRTKRFFRNSGAEVSDEQYAALCAEYDSNEVTEELKKKRRELYERVVGPMNWFRMGFLSDRGFVDNNIVEQKEYVVIDRLGEEHEIGIGRNLWFLNYVAFSNDSRRAIISGKYKDSSGLCVIYDFESKRNVHASFDTMAVWRGVFSSRGDAAYYDSTPDTYLLPRNESRCIDIKGRSFLTFSPSGRYMALSKQGYICGKGHVPDCDVYIVETDDPEEELAHYNDHGCEITGVQFRETVACASFSQDEGKLLTVGSDGVVVVRFLDLE